MKKLLTILALIVASYSAKAEIKLGDGENAAVLSGYVKTDMFFDTRLTTNAREGHFMMWPQKEVLDANGKDVNERLNTNFLSIQTRLNLKINGPEVLGAKTFGFIEAEFFGTSSGDVNGVRMRHAYVDINWGMTSLRVGQTWHPLFNADIYPGVVSFNTGVPFMPFSRAPQIRFNQYFSKEFCVSLTASSQRDFASYGPISDLPASDYLRNSGVPDLTAGITYKTKGFIFNANGEYKMIVPKTTITNSTNQTIKTDQTVNSFAANAYIKVNADLFTFKAQGLYGQNLSDYMLIGGYALKSVEDATLKEEYTPIAAMTAWGEIIYGKDIELALFAGYSKNLGAADNVSSNFTKATLYGKGTDIDNILRLSPRVIFTFGNFKFAAEVEYTSAAFGTNDLTDKLKIINTKTVSNIRGLLAVYLNI